MKQQISNLADVFFKIQKYLIKEGNKTLISKLINKSLLDIQNTIRIPLTFLFSLFIFNTNIYVEARTVTPHKNKTRIIPMGIKLKRRLFLVFKWFVLALSKKSQQFSLVERFKTEFLYVAANEKTETLKFRAFNNMKALANRANMHYRW